MIWIIVAALVGACVGFSLWAWAICKVGSAADQVRAEFDEPVAIFVFPGLDYRRPKTPQEVTAVVTHLVDFYD